MKSESKTKEGISDLVNENDSLRNSDKEKADILNRFLLVCSQGRIWDLYPD